MTQKATEDDLFVSVAHTHEPLAARMRPRTLDEYIGQDHIVGKGRLLRRAIAADQLTSVIFYGPPGSGKTTLARVIANHTKSNFITLNAVLTGVADIRKAIADAESQRTLYSRKTILFVDEVHRWNKSQQDALLPWVENGTIILIGATTENPFFEVNKALVSRSRVFQLKPLTHADLMKAAHQALADVERGYGHWQVMFEEGALEHLVETANGDARSLLNALELAVETTPERWIPSATPPVPSYGSTIYISKEAAEESIQKKVVLYDRDGDYHYDIISAFIKSLRGRDPDAACYWLARMVKAGEDPAFIFRRMLISACEDTGLADPHAISVVESCASAFERVGFPEGRYFLAHAALYLSTAPKSNSSMAFFDALASVEKEDADVPNHLKDPSRDAEGFGHGTGYLYPHAYRDHWVAQQYLPDALTGKIFYTPTTQGYEATIRDDVLSRREIQIAALLEETANGGEPTNPVSEWWMQEHFKGSAFSSEENLTFSPVNKKKEAHLSAVEREWRSRLDTNRAEALTEIREQITDMAHILRHHRSLIWNADNALLLFDITRRTPEGITCGLCKNPQALAVLEQYARTLDDLDRPQLKAEYAPSKKGANVFSDGTFLKSAAQYNDVMFDRLFFRDVIASKQDATAFSRAIRTAFLGQSKTERDIAFSEDEPLHKTIPALCAPDAVVVLSQRIPCHGQKISSIITQDIFDGRPLDAKTSALVDSMHKAETDFFGSQENPLFCWNSETLSGIFAEEGFSVSQKITTLTEKRRISLEELGRWFHPEHSAYGAFLTQQLGREACNRVQAMLETAAQSMLFTWRTEMAFFTLVFRA